jgi:hypothetical protein
LISPRGESRQCVVRSVRYMDGAALFILEVFVLGY